ncbi:MAG: ATP-binding protein [Bacteroidales bacterium]|nr:ATP-binding protein [Bacteroidales bacterium]
MGLYLNPNSELLKESMQTEIYVDKSLIIRELNRCVKTEFKFLCISRPRRFGKSMASHLISSYYGKTTDALPLFEKLKIYKDESFNKHFGKYNVIKLDINGMYRTVRNKINLVEEINQDVVEEMIEQFPDVNIPENSTIAKAMQKVFAKTGEQFVVIMDEYDVLIREEVDDNIFLPYLEFLNGLFKNSILKPAIAMAYLTGILPIIRDKVESKLNEFREITILNANRFAEFTGFTKDEVKELCQRYSMDYGECLHWYDGYRLTKDVSVCNPKAVVAAMMDNEFANHWSNTGSYENIKDYIEYDFDGIRQDVETMLGGGRIRVNVLSFLNTKKCFKNKDDVFTYLIHLGYLTYDKDTKECYIPNYEVREQWFLALRDNKNYAPVMKMINESEKLLEETINGNSEYVAAALKEAHSRQTNPFTYNDERTFQSAIGLAFFAANNYYTVIKELPSGDGYADLAFVPIDSNRPALIIELKSSTSTAQGAIDQIKKKNYKQVLRNYAGNMILIGIKYYPNTHEHECVIERMEY